MRDEFQGEGYAPAVQWTPILMCTLRYKWNNAGFLRHRSGTPIGCAVQDTWPQAGGEIDFEAGA
jgi:hypothetical protein